MFFNTFFLVLYIYIHAVHLPNRLEFAGGTNSGSCNYAKKTFNLADESGDPVDNLLFVGGLL